MTVAELDMFEILFDFLLVFAHKNLTPFGKIYYGATTLSKVRFYMRQFAFLFLPTLRGKIKTDAYQ